MQMRNEMQAGSGEAERRAWREGASWVGVWSVKQRLPEDNLKRTITKKLIQIGVCAVLTAHMGGK